MVEYELKTSKGSAIPWHGNAYRAFVDKADSGKKSEVRYDARGNNWPGEKFPCCRQDN